MQHNSKIIGVVSNQFSNPYSVKLLNEVTRQLNQRGCMTLLLNVDADARYPALLQMAEQLQVGGLLFLDAVAPQQIETAAEVLPQVPAIVLGSDAAQGVSADDYAAGVDIGQLLLAQGHERFGYLQGNASVTPLARREGYLAALQQADKTLSAELTADGDDRERAYQATMAYLKKARSSERINVLFCENDELAFGAQQAIRDFGQGVHIAVAGFGDVDEARASTWHLTSWAPRSDLLVNEALNRLLDNKADDNGAWRQGELQVRHSHLGKHVHNHADMVKCGCAIRH